MRDMWMKDRKKRGKETGGRPACDIMMQSQSGQMFFLVWLKSLDSTYMQTQNGMPKQNADHKSKH